jgi:glucose/mannose-6-phosphate isomerase
MPDTPDDKNSSAANGSTGHPEAIDPENMHGAIMSFPDQLHQAEALVDQVNWTAFKPTTPAGIAVCGMGGSAIGGDLVRSYWEPESAIPMIVIRQEQLPAAVNRFWLIVASSYSGNTTETLAATQEAASRGCRILALTTGGKLKELAEIHGWPLITLPTGHAPRAALGYSFGPLMLSLAHWGVTPDHAIALRQAADFLKVRAKNLVNGEPGEIDLANQVDRQLKDRMITVLGTAGTTDVIAYRIACQLCENSKALAVSATLPEWNHNGIVGFNAAADKKGHAVVLLVDPDDSPIAKRRQAWVARLCLLLEVPLVTLQAAGSNRLQRMLSLVQEGDFLSYHLAVASGQDPTPIAAINNLKAYLESTD